MKKQYRNTNWFSFAEKIKQRDNYKCVKCGRSNIVLQVHHLQYKTDLNIWEYPMSDCVTLCKYCHAVEHNIIEPTSGWTLLSIDDNGDCSYKCERPNCNHPIRYEYNVYHPKVGYMVVGSTCVEFLTEDDKKLISYITQLQKSVKQFILNKKWENGKTKNGYSFIETTYRKTNKLRIYGSFPNFAIQVYLYKERKFDKVRPLNNKTLEQCKEILYFIIRGWISSKKEEKETIRKLCLLALS